MINNSKWNSILLSLMLIIYVGLIGLNGCSQVTKGIANNDIKKKDNSTSNTKNPYNVHTMYTGVL